jgi:alkylation response protein AidB-like acyl-CoA dehydrogenase
MINLSQQEIIYRACAHLTFFTTFLLGKSEVEKDNFSINMVRLLTPVGKSFCSKLSVGVISECMEALGGNGYIEEWFFFFFFFLSLFNFFHLGGLENFFVIHKLILFGKVQQMY